MIYTTGTIAISGNTLTGTGTNFTAAGSLIRVGCTVITMTSPPQVFQINGITSGTVMTVSPAASPALAAGTKYSILLSDSLSVDGLAQDIAETFKMYQSNISGFADVMNGTGDVIITINGISVTVPGQKSLAKKGANKDITSLTGLTTPLSVGQGGTGMNVAPTPAQLRTNAGLGTAATFNVDFGGVSGSNITIAPQLHKNFRGWSAEEADLTKVWPRGVSVGLMTANQGWSGDSTTYIGVASFRAWDDKSAGINSCFLLASTGGGLRYRRSTGYSDDGNDLKYSTVHTIYSTQNTTKSSDGTLKAASPVARIANPDSTVRSDIDDDGFEWCGYGVANSEAHGIQITRDDIGVYRVTGAKSLASSGWRLLPPRDPDGNGDLGVVTAEQHDAEIIITLFRRKMVLANGEIIIQPGESIDVPANSWIDIRLDMPESPIPPEPEQPLIQPDTEPQPE